jgi:hypothetical protein
MSAQFFARLKEVEARVTTLESDNKWLKDALTKVLAQDSGKSHDSVRTVQTAKPGKAA